MPFRCVVDTARFAIRTHCSTRPKSDFPAGNAVNSGCIDEIWSRALHRHPEFNPPPRDRVSKIQSTWPSPGIALAWTDRMHSGHHYLCQIHAPATVHIGVDAKPDLLSLGYRYHSRVGPPYYYGRLCAMKPGLMLPSRQG